MAKHTVYITFKNGVFSYMDANGNPADTLIARYYDTVQWICNDHEFDITFFDGAKQQTPFAFDPIKGHNGQTFAFTIIAQVAGGRSEDFPYSVTLRDTGDTDDPRIQVQNPPGHLVATGLSARNQLEGKIVDLKLGTIMAHVVVEIGENRIESVITRRSAEEMELKLGDHVTVIIKSTEVMIGKG